MRRFRHALLAVAATCLLLPATALGQADDAEALVDSLLEQVEAAASEAGIPVEDLLSGELAFDVDPERPVLTLREAIEWLAGDLEAPAVPRLGGTNPESTGIAGLPEIQVGQQFHLYLDADLETFITSSTPLGIHPDNLPEEPELLRYDVEESEYVPNTPIVPAINPLILLDLPEGLEELQSPMILLSTGGPLKSVQGRGWDFASHMPGDALIGQSVSTRPREATVADPFPIYVPFFTGDVVEDESIDFVGFGEAIQAQTCVAPVINIPFVGPRVQARVCASLGTVIGVGAAQYDYSSIDLRQTLLPLWQEPPEAVQEIVGLVNGIVGEVPVGDVLEQALGLLGGDLPDLEDDLDIPDEPELP